MPNEDKTAGRLWRSSRGLLDTEFRMYDGAGKATPAIALLAPLGDSVRTAWMDSEHEHERGHQKETR